jgi:hypothetical protein
MKSYGCNLQRIFKKKNNFFNKFSSVWRHGWGGSLCVAGNAGYAVRAHGTEAGDPDAP